MIIYNWIKCFYYLLEITLLGRQKPVKLARWFDKLTTKQMRLVARPTARYTLHRSHHLRDLYILMESLENKKIMLEALVRHREGCFDLEFSTTLLQSLGRLGVTTFSDRPSLSLKSVGNTVTLVGLLSKLSTLPYHDRVDENCRQSTYTQLLVECLDDLFYIESADIDRAYALVVGTRRWLMLTGGKSPVKNYKLLLRRIGREGTNKMRVNLVGMRVNVKDLRKSNYIKKSK